MQPDDMSKFEQLLKAVCALYKHHMNELSLELYQQALIGFEFEAVEQAFQAHINHPSIGQFMPNPADLLRYLQEDGDTEMQAWQAWTRVQQIMRDVGSDHTLVFDDAILHQVIEDMGGWIRLSERTIKELDFLAHEFKKRYAAYLLRPPESYPRQLTGRFDRQNSQFGYEAQPPLLIGDAQKAQQVYQQGRAPGSSRRVVPLLLSESMSKLKRLADQALKRPDSDMIQEEH